MYNRKTFYCLFYVFYMPFFCQRKGSQHSFVHTFSSGTSVSQVLGLHAHYPLTKVESCQDSVLWSQSQGCDSKSELVGQALSRI